MIIVTYSCPHRIDSRSVLLRVVSYPCVGIMVVALHDVYNEMFAGRNKLPGGTMAERLFLRKAKENSRIHAQQIGKGSGGVAGV